VTSSFGGWFAGALADRFGRVRILQIAILRGKPVINRAFPPIFHSSKALKTRLDAF
jgi:hypothetical protein